MALEFAKELLGDAYTGELEEKLEAKINELYAPKADLDAASARADGLQEQLDAANEAIGKFEGLDAEQVKAQIADYKQRAEAAEKDRDEKLAAAAFDAKIDKALSGRTEKRRIPVRPGGSGTCARIRHRDLCCAGRGEIYRQRNRHAQGCGSARGLTVSHTLYRKAR